MGRVGWAAPKAKDGKLDHHNAKTADDLIDFVNIESFSAISPKWWSSTFPG
jgi:hypothetical protein